MSNQTKYFFKLFAAIFAFISLSITIKSMALEPPTHRLINERIALNTMKGFYLDDYLKTQLGMPAGYNTSYDNKKVYQWISDGGEKEDSNYDLRYLNHFLDPISNTGLSGQSSAVEWALKTTGSQAIWGNYSWCDARNYYYTALTASDKATRETNFAETFRALGQVMHLVQDVSVPEHARKDLHGFGSDYEKWVDSKVRPKITSYTPTFFMPNTSYPLSITNIFDTNQYNGTNPHITIEEAMGLSEYTNANFLSPDTIFTNFAYPAYSDLIENPLVENGKDVLYLTKSGHGETINHLARAQNFYKYLPPDYKKLALTTNDNEVHNNYANNLIPRAIGYSSQILSYFFRAKMDMVPADPATEGFVIKNDSAETMEGEFHLYYDNESDSRVEIQSGDFPINAMRIGGNGSSASVNFDTPPDAKKPGEYILVFRGKMGEETGSVAARVVLIENAEFVIVTMSMDDSKRCFVWNVAKNELAIINDNSGYPATFPCDPANISNWANSHKSIGNPLFEEATCGINALPLNASCNVYSSCTKTCSDEDSYDQPTDCGGEFRNTGTQLYNRVGEYKSDLTTHEHYDNWKYPFAAQDMGAWWYHSGYPKQLSIKLSYLNQSSVTGSFRIERTADRYFYRNSDGGNCTNKYDGYSTNEEKLSFHVPLANAMVFSNTSIANNNWDLVARTGSQTEENTIRALNARLYGEFSGNTIAQIHAFAISTGTRFADCCNDPYYGICAGPGCTGTYTCPWSPIVYTVSDLKVAAQVGYFKDGTAGIDPTELPRNSSFESIISDMYATLRNAENVPSDKLAGFGLSVQIK